MSESWILNDIRMEIKAIDSTTHEDTPEVDENEQTDRRELVKREQEGEDMIRKRLRPAVDGMEGVRGIGGGHDPLVVWLVKALVDQRMVKATVDQVDAGVGK